MKRFSPRQHHNGRRATRISPGTGRQSQTPSAKRYCPAASTCQAKGTPPSHQSHRASWSEDLVRRNNVIKSPRHSCPGASVRQRLHKACSHSFRLPVQHADIATTANHIQDARKMPIWQRPVGAGAVALILGDEDMGL